MFFFKKNPDLELVDRLVAFYRACFSPRHYCGVWGDLFMTRQQSAHQTFMSGTVEQCAQLLADPCLSEMQFGFELLNVEHANGLNESEKARQNYEKVCSDALASVAEAIGAVKLAGEHGERNILSADDLIAAIERVAGKIEFPNPYPLEFGIRTCRGIASQRAILAIYHAWRIEALTKGSIVEIGAGLGRTAYACFKRGLEDYTIVDLPFTCLSSGYFLGKTLGPQSICLAGDSSGPIKIIPPSDFIGTYDLVVNIDSLPEIGREAASEYAQRLSRSKAFFSINHEANEFSVRDLMGNGQRHIHPLRRGYVEELFHFTH